MKFVFRVAGALAMTGIMAGAAFAGAVEKLESFAAGTQTATGKFVQEVVDRDGNRVDATSGVFAFARPGSFVWNVTNPYSQSIVSNGLKLWLYDADLGQVTVRTVASNAGASPAAVLFGKGNLRENFELSEAGDSEGLSWVRARSLAEDLTYRHADIGFDNDGNLRKMHLTDHFSQVTRIEFTEVELNAVMPAAQFEFKIPKGVDVLVDGS